MRCNSQASTTGRGTPSIGTRAFSGLKPETPTILLSHQPTVLDLPQTENVSLILSGHTHGGQVRLPFVGAPARFATKDLKYDRGLVQPGRDAVVRVEWNRSDWSTVKIRGATGNRGAPAAGARFRLTIRISIEYFMTQS